MKGLNENDFSPRWLDNAVPGFTTSDPLAELHPDESPYQYCGNNPVNRVDPTGMEWYWNDDGKDPVWFDGDEDIEGYESHDDNVYKQSGESEDYKWYHYSSTESGNSPNDDSAQNNENQANYYMYGSSGQDDNNNIVPDRSVGNSGNSNSGLNGDDRLSKLPAAAGMTVDVMSTTGATIKATTKITEAVISHALTRPTTLIGAALSGGPAIINIWNHGVNTNDLVTVGISAVAIGLEFSPEGVAINIASAAVSLGSVAWDAYTLTHQENR